MKLPLRKKSQEKNQRRIAFQYEEEDENVKKAGS